MMNQDIFHYHNSLPAEDKIVCDQLYSIIDAKLPDAVSKVWHGHPVWFLNGNPIVGYSKQKSGVRLMFWSGAGFDESGLNVVGKKFKDASVFYQSVSELKPEEMQRWLDKSRIIQWDYKNLVKKKGQLDKLLSNERI